MSSTSTSTTTTTPTFLQCKVYLKPTDQVRRIQIDANCSLADFIHVAHQLYASNPLLAQQQQRIQPTITISVTYMDEESDWITVTTDPEWRDALQRQVQLLKSQSSLLFKVQCTQIALPTRPQQQQSQPQQQQHSVPTANAVGETLCSTACSLIDQVKRGHHQHVQPLVEQARDKTKDKVKKIQNWINESEDLHSIKQTFRDVLDTVVDEGSTTAALLISQLYKDIETIATVTGATTSAASGSASSSTWYANNDDEGDDEIVQQERQEEAQEEPREEQEQEQQHQEEEEEEAEQQEQQQQGEVNVAPEDDFVFVDNEHLPEQQAQEEQQVVVGQEEEEEEQQQPVEEPTPVEAEPEPMPVIEQQQPEEEEEEEQVVEQEQQQQEVQAVPLEEPEAIPAPVQEQPQPQPQQPVDPRYQQYADKLTSLREMGFNDIDTNLNLLIKHKGDLTQVVTELLSL